MKNIQKSFSGKLKKKNGFTLIEMLIVVAIIAILVLVSIPLVTTSLDKARQATDDANVRAAKAAAVVEYLGNDEVLTTKTIYYYDAEDGNLTTNATDIQKVYGQKEKDKIVEVTIDPEKDGKAEPTITCKWVDKPAS